MRLIILFIFFQISAWAQISTIHSFKEADMSGLTDKSLVLFDVDDVLIATKDPIFRLRGNYKPQCWKNIDKEEKYHLQSIMLAGADFILVEPSAPSVVHTLQKKGIKTLGLTAARTGKFGVIEDTVQWRIDQLLKHNIDFGTFPGAYIFSHLVSADSNSSATTNP